MSSLWQTDQDRAETITKEEAFKLTAAFSNRFREAIGKDARPAGEIAVGILIYLSSTIPEPIDKHAN